MGWPDGSHPFFSVIMPVHGVQRYIADAIADVCVQTFPDFELIVIDDRSPDRSAEIAQAVAGDDARMRVIRHDAKRGAAAARNTGIEAARGAWALFLDPDDRYADTLLERVRAAIDAQACDAVVYGHAQEHFDRDGSFLYDNVVPLAPGTYRKGPELGRAVIDLEAGTHLGYVWNKAYRLDVIRENGVRFEDGLLLIEDIMFNLAFLEHAGAICVIPDVLYRYAKRLASNQTNEFVPRYFELHRRRIEDIRDFCEESGALDDDARSTLGALYARYILSALERNVDPRANMTRAQRAAWLEWLFADELFCELVGVARARDSRALAACIALLNARNAPALLALAHVIHAVRAYSTTLYTKAKAGR